MRSAFPTAIALAALLASGTSVARDFSKEAADAREQNLPALSIYVDANWGNRTNGAAKALTKAHAAFGQAGYELVDVATYSENGDLQGFFVSYRQRRDATPAAVRP
jgi:hypothetical protein